MRNSQRVQISVPYAVRKKMKDRRFENFNWSAIASSAFIEAMGGESTAAEIQRLRSENGNLRQLLDNIHAASAIAPVEVPN